MKKRWEQVGTCSEVGRGRLKTDNSSTRIIKRGRRRKGGSMGDSLVQLRIQNFMKMDVKGGNQCGGGEGRMGESARMKRGHPEAIGEQHKSTSKRKCLNNFN